MYLLGVVLGIWAALSYGQLIPELFLPPPDRVLFSLIDLFLHYHFIQDVAISTGRVLVGFLISAALAVPLGIMIASADSWQRTFAPAIGALRFVPAAAFIPLSILWLGIGFWQKVLILFISIFFYLVILVADVARETSKVLVEAAQTLGASQREVIQKVIVPSSLPGIWDALRLMMGVGWTMIVVAELVGAERGVGAMIIQAQRFLQTPKVIAGILFIGGLGVVFDYLFRVAEARLFPWIERMDTG